MKNRILILYIFSNSSKLSVLFIRCFSQKYINAEMKSIPFDDLLLGNFKPFIFVDIAGLFKFK